MHEPLTPEAAQAAPSTAVRLLRSQQTHQYFTGEGWTDNPVNAQPFPNEVEAARACITHNLHDIELVLQMPGGGPELFATSMR